MPSNRRLSTLLSLPALAALLLLCAAPPAMAADAGGVKVTAAWARATAGKARAGAAFLTITNSGAAADRLTGAATDRAKHAMVHQNIVENDVASMRHVMALDVPAGKSVTFAPGGYHVMLMGLTAPLKKGERFPLSLTFEKAGTVTVTVTVEGPGARGPMGGMGHHAH